MQNPLETTPKGSEGGPPLLVVPYNVVVTYLSFVCFFVSMMFQRVSFQMFFFG